MKNRPDKPGCNNWWYETIHGNIEYAKVCVASDGTFAVFVIDQQGAYCGDDFEDDSEFKRWIGQAHPPKRLRLLSKGGVINDHEYTGLYARRADVADFIAADFIAQEEE